MKIVHLTGLCSNCNCLNPTTFKYAVYSEGNIIEGPCMRCGHKGLFVTNGWFVKKDGMLQLSHHSYDKTKLFRDLREALESDNDAKLMQVWAQYMHTPEGENLQTERIVPPALKGFLLGLFIELLVALAFGAGQNIIDQIQNSKIIPQHQEVQEIINTIMEDDSKTRQQKQNKINNLLQNSLQPALPSETILTNQEEEYIQKYSLEVCTDQLFYGVVVPLDGVFFKNCIFDMAVLIYSGNPSGFGIIDSILSNQYSVLGAPNLAQIDQEFIYGLKESLDHRG